MASLRGGQSLWNNKSVAQNDVSAFANIGPGPYVAVYILNSGATSATFDVEVAATVTPEAGRNGLTAASDGGLIWCKLTGHTAITVAAGAKVAVDLAPFSAEFVRLVRTDATGTEAITAFVSAFGPS